MKIRTVAAPGICQRQTFDNDTDGCRPCGFTDYSGKHKMMRLCRNTDVPGMNCLVSTDSRCHTRLTRLRHWTLKIHRRRWTLDVRYSARKRVALHTARTSLDPHAHARPCILQLAAAADRPRPALGQTKDPHPLWSVLHTVGPHLGLLLPGAQKHASLTLIRGAAKPGRWECRGTRGASPPEARPCCSVSRWAE